MAIRVRSLHIYPIKSCGAINVDELKFGARGPLYDREWMLADSVTGKFVSQRDFPMLTKIRPHLENEQLRIEIPGADDLRVPLAHPENRVAIEVNVWGSSGPMAYEVSTDVSKAFSQYVGKTVRFVRSEPNFQRRIKETNGFQDKALTLVDGMPVLLTSQSSLEDLNSRLNDATRMDSFRANIVIEGALDPFVESTWKQIVVGSMRFDSSTPCTRCIIVTTNQQTGLRDPAVLKTLASYQRDERGRVVFGRYLVHEQEGVLRKGDTVSVTS